MRDIFILILFFFTSFIFSQNIPPGYQNVATFYTNAYGKPKVYTSKDKSHILIRYGYKPSFYEIYNTKTHELVNKVQTSQYTTPRYEQNNVFYVSYQDRNGYKFSLNGNAISVKKSEIKKLPTFWSGGITEVESPYFPSKNIMYLWTGRNIEIFEYKENQPIVENNIPEKIEEFDGPRDPKFYALIVGVDQYDDLEIIDLDNPVNDAQRFYNVLIDNYSYKKEDVVVMSNSTKDEFLIQLDRFSEILNEEDNLLVFFAGHGYWDENFSEGYWFLRDSQKNARRTWLANNTIQSYLRGIKAKNILLIADSCFSGSIFKGRSVGIENASAIREIYDTPSRKAMTSGNLSEVPDNSVFIEFLIKRLSENQQKFLTAGDLFSKLKIAVINNSVNSQIPQFGTITATGDEGGGFLFVRNN